MSRRYDCVKLEGGLFRDRVELVFGTMDQGSCAAASLRLVGHSTGLSIIRRGPSQITNLGNLPMTRPICSIAWQTTRSSRFALYLSLATPKARESQPFARLLRLCQTPKWIDDLAVHVCWNLAAILVDVKRATPLNALDADMSYL